MDEGPSRHTRSGKPELIDTGNGYTVKYKGRHLYSAFKPEESVRRKVEGTNISGKTLVFVPSIGLGYGLDLLLAKLPPDSHILCTETDPVLCDFAFSQKVRAIPASPQLTCVMNGLPSESLLALRRIGVWRFRRVTTVRLCAGYSLDPTPYQEIASLLESEIETFWKNKMTLVRLSPLWVKNLFYNLPRIPNAPHFADFSTDMPVIVAGAGPSLEESIACIKRSRKSSVLIAVDTALPILMKESIRPDFIFMLEAQLANIHDFISHRDPTIPVLADITASPQVFRAIGNPASFFSSGFYPTGILARLGAAGLLPPEIPALGSVGIAAVYGALRITSGPVIVTGLDFAYSGGKTHAKGSPFQEILDVSCKRTRPTSATVYSCIRNRPLIRTNDKNGTAALTDLILLSYSKLMKNAVGEDWQRVVDIGRSGVDLGLKRIGDGKDFDELVSGVVMRKTTQKKKTDRSATMPDITRFITNEIGLLKRGLECAKNLLEQAEHPDREIDEESMKTLKEIDYTYLHFPEPEPYPLFDKSYLFRLVVSIVHYIEIAKRSLSFATGD